MRWVLRGSGRWVSRGGGVMAWAVVTSSHLTFWRLHSRRGQRQTLSLLPLTLSILPLSPQVFFSFFLLFFIFCLQTIESSDCQVAQVYRHSKPLLSLFFFLGLSNSNLSSSMSVFSPPLFIDKIHSDRKVVRSRMAQSKSIQKFWVGFENIMRLLRGCKVLNSMIWPQDRWLLTIFVFDAQVMSTLKTHGENRMVCAGI